MFKKAQHFLKDEIWRIRIRERSGTKYFLIRPLRILLLALRGFAEDNCQLRASALTFYSILSVVPVAAMAFGIAKGFGFERNLEALLTEKLQGQEEVVRWIIQFADTLLINTKGGLIAGVGVLILFWAVINLLDNIEKAFNDIWYLKRGRSFVRKLSDYLSIMLICPILLIVSSSLLVFIAGEMTLITEKITLLGNIGSLIFFFLSLSPYVVLWILFTFVFIVMPNTGVSFKGGLLAGVITGTLFLLVQKSYIYFQVGVAKYNAIYGSFAALPLFVLWLQVSWLVVLFGAELSFAADNEENYEFEPDCSEVSLRFRRILALRITMLCVKDFFKGEKPLDTLRIAQALEVPIRLVRAILFELVEAGVLSELKQGDTDKNYFQPAQDPTKLTIKRVLDLLDKQGKETLPTVNDEEFEKLAGKLESMDRLIDSSPQNVPLRDL